MTAKCVHPSVHQTATAWLQQFSLAVRERDFNVGRALFAEDVVAFGSVSAALRGLDDLHNRQWQVVWNNTEGFDYDYAQIDARGVDDLIWVAAVWKSVGLREDGGQFPRAGRATYVLAKQNDGVWRAVHSHHSCNPSGDL